MPNNGFQRTVLALRARPAAEPGRSAAHGGEVIWGLALLSYEFGRRIVILGATLAKSCAAVLLLPPPLTLAMT